MSGRARTSPGSATGRRTTSGPRSRGTEKRWRAEWSSARPRSPIHAGTSVQPRQAPRRADLPWISADSGQTVGYGAFITPVPAGTTGAKRVTVAGDFIVVELEGALETAPLPHPAMRAGRLLTNPMILVCALLFAAAGALADGKDRPVVRGDGQLVRAARPWRGIGVNYFDAFSRTLAPEGDTSYEAGFTVSPAGGNPVRADTGAAAFWPREFNALYQEDPAA